MVTITQPGRVLRYGINWFSAHPPSPLAALRPVIYWCCRDGGEVAGFHREAHFTNLVALDRPWEEIEKGFSVNTAYKMRRAAREGVTCLFDEDVSGFLEFFSIFAAQKGLLAPRAAQLDSYRGHAVIAKALLAERPLVMHFYLVDPAAGRVRMLHSASHYRALSEAAGRDVVGRANRLLHREAMRHFRETGHLRYDLGGYAPRSQDPELMAINRFKDGLGGEVVPEVHYTSLMLRLAQRVRGWLHESPGSASHADKNQ